MACNTEKMEEQSPQCEQQEKETTEQQNLVERVANLPLVSSAYSAVQGVYTSTKDSHPYIRSVCDVAEKVAKTLTEVAVSGSKPILNRLEPTIATANDLACKGLDKLESALPILQQPAEKVVSDAKSLVTGARDTVVSAVTNTVTGACDTVTGTVSGIVGLATGAVQGGIGATRSAVTTAIESPMGQFVTNSVGSVLTKSEEWVDHYLPMTDEELSQLASTVEGFDVAPLQQQREQQSYYVRLGSLSSRLRHRAYQHSLGKVRNAHTSTVEVLGQLHQTFDLMETVNKKVQGGREKLNQLWLDWSKKQQEGQDGATEGDSQQLDFRVLNMTRALTKQLQTTCFTLVSSAQGLPANIQERMQQLRTNVQELHSVFSSIHSINDISDLILAQSRGKVAQIQDQINGVFTHVNMHHPLAWIVGPFAPQLVERPETPPMEEETSDQSCH
ncbi:LOW QUALITY PROTEIN: perilipin-3-like [Hyperolius riggenbachi]|uniref:LOW QUALITY PROTEIN: perilipin-3-like n=1 Tax=Hyperolius riggenbachi TaxID=752182 RepID=UPI0035A279FB